MFDPVRNRHYYNYYYLVLRRNSAWEFHPLPRWQTQQHALDDLTFLGTKYA